MDPIASHFQELQTVIQIHENQTNFSEKYLQVNDNISNFNTQLNHSEHSSTNRTNDIPFHPEEWFVTDVLTGRKRAPRQNEFLFLLLQHPRYSSYISWLDQSQGVFKIHRSQEVATLWGQVKNRQTTGLMDYETFARGIRFYYKSGLMIKTHKKRTFRFKLPIDISI